MKRKFSKPVPENIKRRTAYNQKRYRMSLADAFNEACGVLASPGTELHDAWYRGDFYDYIPQVYWCIPDNHCAWMEPKAAHEWIVNHLKQYDEHPTHALGEETIKRICGEAVFNGLVAGGYIKYAGNYAASGMPCYTITM
jgi:hypothetical protein